MFISQRNVWYSCFWKYFKHYKQNSQSKDTKLQEDKSELTTLPFKYTLLFDAMLSHYTCLRCLSKFLWSVNNNVK